MAVVDPQMTDTPTATRATLRAAYSDRDALLMARLSEAAYLPIETREGKEAREVRLSEMGFALLEAYHTAPTGFMKRRRGTEAYLCANEDMTVLVFRGSTDGRDLLTNANVLKKKLTIGTYDGAPQIVKVHRGYYDAFKEHISRMSAAIHRIKREHPHKPIFITGHSLGGTLAQLATLTWSCDQIGACYTFGSPRAGTRSLDRFVKPPHYRVTNEWDSVPFTPAYILGYRHTGDPRSVVGTPPRLLRYSRSILQQWLIVLLRLLVLPLQLIPFFRPRGLFLLVEHNIGRYVERLEALVQRRSGLVQTTPPKPRDTDAA